MTPTERQEFVVALYEHLQHRTPNSKELSHWAGFLANGLSEKDVFHRFISSKEYKNKNRVEPGHPAGHYYSPVVDPSTVGDYVSRSREESSRSIAGLGIDIAEMSRLWEKNIDVIRKTRFAAHKVATNRYYFRNGMFSYGDATILRMLIGDLRPRRIIEIGSGFSSACILDSLQEFGLPGTVLCCIEPYPARLHRLIGDDDASAIEILPSQVQDVPLDVFKRLDENDILFIDSTHVLKTGSDVHYELFHILPSIRPGVFVHFHDIHYPFEYPDGWIFEKRYSWNEAYAIRAFLMYNNAFEVVFFNSMFAALCKDRISADLPMFLRNPGGSLWLKKV